MKKTISLFFAACLAISVQAQVYMVNDFESGLNGANAAWGGEVDWVDNPCSSNDNASSKVLKVVSTSYANVAIPVTLPEGKTLADYSGVRIQLAILDNSSVNFLISSSGEFIFVFNFSSNIFFRSYNLSISSAIYFSTARLRAS